MCHHAAEVRYTDCDMDIANGKLQPLETKPRSTANKLQTEVDDESPD